MSIIADALEKAAQRRGSTSPSASNVGQRSVEISPGEVSGSVTLKDSALKIRPLILTTVLIIAAVAAYFFGPSRPAKKASTQSGSSSAPTLAAKSQEQPTMPQAKRGDGAAKGDSGFVLSGIVWDQGEPIAVINNLVLWQGDSIEGAKVVEIAPRTVTLLKDEREIVLKLE